MKYLPLLCLLLLVGTVSAQPLEPLPPGHMPLIIVVVMVIGLAALAIYSLADNERLYGSIIASILATMLAFVLGMSFINNGIMDTTSGTTLIYTLPRLGYFSLFIGVVMALVTIILIMQMVFQHRGVDAT